MTAMYDEVSPSMVAALASEIVERHRTGGCERCTPAGCEDLAWARPALAEHRSARAAYLAAPPRF